MARGAAAVKAEMHAVLLGRYYTRTRTFGPFPGPGSRNAGIAAAARILSCSEQLVVLQL
jgi:hypothetical protein